MECTLLLYKNNTERVKNKSEYEWRNSSDTSCSGVIANDVLSEFNIQDYKHAKTTSNGEEIETVTITTSKMCCYRLGKMTVGSILANEMVLGNDVRAKHKNNIFQFLKNSIDDKSLRLNNYILFDIFENKSVEDISIMLEIDIELIFDRILNLKDEELIEDNIIILRTISTYRELFEYSTRVRKDI